MYGCDFQQASSHAQVPSDNLLLVAVSASGTGTIEFKHNLVALLEVQVCLVKMAKGSPCTAVPQLVMMAKACLVQQYCNLVASFRFTLSQTRPILIRMRNFSIC